MKLGSRLFLPGRRAARAGATVIIVCLLLGILAPAALAHTPSVTGSAECIAGEWVVTWTVTNSETTSGTNRTMTIDTLTLAPSGSVAGLAAGQQFAPQPTVGSTKTGTSTYPGSTSGTFTLTVVADWDDGGPQNVTSDPPASVTLDGSCTTPAAPSAAIAQADCAKGGVEITFTNTGGETAVFQVFKGSNPTPIDTRTVLAGDLPLTVLYTMAENETATFKVTSGSYEISETRTLDCFKPSAIVTLECVTPYGAKVVATNSGQLPGTFVVTKNGTQIDSFQVAAGATETRKYPLADEERATFEVTGLATSQEVFNNCLEILGLKAKRPLGVPVAAAAAAAQLPATGSNSTFPLLALALGLIGAGTVLVSTANRRPGGTLKFYPASRLVVAGGPTPFANLLKTRAPQPPSADSTRVPAMRPGIVKARGT